jgi:hypothetical protein
MGLDNSNNERHDSGMALKPPLYLYDARGCQ